MINLVIDGSHASLKIGGVIATVLMIFLALGVISTVIKVYIKYLDLQLKIKKDKTE